VDFSPRRSFLVEARHAREPATRDRVWSSPSEVLLIWIFSDPGARLYSDRPLSLLSPPPLRSLIFLSFFSAEIRFPFLSRSYPRGRFPLRARSALAFLFPVPHGAACSPFSTCSCSHCPARAAPADPRVSVLLVRFFSSDVQRNRTCSKAPLNGLARRFRRRFWFNPFRPLSPRESRRVPTT